MYTKYFYLANVGSFFMHLQAPMRVFVPYNAIDNDDEVVIKCSVNGGDWQEKNAIFQPGLLKDLKVPMARFLYLNTRKVYLFPRRHLYLISPFKSFRIKTGK